MPPRRSGRNTKKKEEEAKGEDEEKTATETTTPIHEIDERESNVEALEKETAVEEEETQEVISGTKTVEQIKNQENDGGMADVPVPMEVDESGTEGITKETNMVSASESKDESVGKTAETAATPPVIASPGLKFQVLYGSRDDQPMSFLLKVGEANILLDCGWDVSLDESVLHPLTEVLNSVQLVLVSFPDLTHMGALPWVAKHLRPGVPIYSTQPVFKMGQMVLYDLYLSKCMDKGSCSAFSLDDIDAIMNRFQLLKFTQPLEVRQEGKFYLSITPYPAGRVLGGAFWRINYKRVEEVLYAVDFNLKSERYINGAIDALNSLSLDKEQRPSLVITDARSALVVPQDERRLEVDFLEAVTSTLRKGGNVLIPVDTSGRVQSLLLQLNGHWKTDRGLWGYKIVLLHHMARNVIHFTKSMVEWMHPEIIKEFERTLRNPFTLKHVLPAQSMIELEAARGEYKNPLVVLASDESMDGGFSRALATRWASGGENSLILVGHVRKNSLAENFWKLRHLPKAVLSFSVPVIEKIVGEELNQIKEREERERRKALELEEFRRQANEFMEGTMGAALSGLQEEAEAEEVQRRKNNNSNNMQEPLHDQQERGPKEKRRRRRKLAVAAMYKRPRFLLFGCREPAKVLVDAYGEPLLEGECVDQSKFSSQDSSGGGLQGVGNDKSGNAASQIQRWGYYDDVLMTEREAQQRAGTNALKFVMKESTVEVRWKVRSFNMEGRTDGKNLRAVLSNLAPRRLILVHGGNDSFADLRRHASKMVGTQIFVPENPLLLDTPVENGADASQGGRKFDFSKSIVQFAFDTKVLDVGLQEYEGSAWRHRASFGQHLSFKQMGNYRLAMVHATPSEIKDADGKPLIRCEHASGKRRKPFLLADGDVLLTETSQQRPSLRQKLREAGVNPEFQIGPEGASLVCDEGTIVRVKDNRVTLEGPLSESYFKVRAVLYSRFVAL